MFTVVGYKKITAKSTGIEYYEIHTVSNDRFVVGQRCDLFFVRYDMISGLDRLVEGAVAEIRFNRFGKVDSIVIV